MRSQDSTDDSEIDRIVRLKMQPLQLKHFERFCQALSIVFSVLAVAMFKQISVGKAARALVSRDIVQTLVHLILTLVVVFPRLLTWKSIDVFYCALIFLTTAFASPWLTEPAAVMYSTMWTNLTVLCMNVARGSMHVVIPGNLLYALISSATIWVNRQNVSVSVLFPIVAQCLFLSVFPAFAHLLQVSLASAIRQNLQVQAAKELLAAASALLRSCCDVVVELDTDGVITCPALDLGSFLLRGPGFRLQNVRLVDLMSTDEDRCMFQRRLDAPQQSDVGLAEAIHVQMRDGNNIHLKVEILTFKYRHLDGLPRHMIGIREFSDASAARRRNQEGAGGEDEAGNMNRHQEEGEPLVLPEAPALLPVPFDGAPSEDEASSAAASASSDVSPALVMVDTTNSRLPLRGCSSGFQMRIGRLPPDTCLMDIIQQGEDFAKWMKMAVIWGSDWPDCRVTLTMRRGTLRATCRVVEEADTLAIDPQRVTLRFSKIKHSRSHSDGCVGYRPHQNYRGTPVFHMAI